MTIWGNRYNISLDIGLTEIRKEAIETAISLRAARVNAGYKQKDAAQELGITNDTLRSWESGKTFPSVPQIKKIEELYHLSYADIIFLPDGSV